MTHDRIRSLDTTHRGSVATDDPCYVVGVDIGGTNLRLALADGNGAIEARWACSTAGLRDAEVVVQLIKQGVEHLLAQHPAANQSLRAIAAGAPGITDVEAGIVIATSYLMGWRDVPLRAMLEEAFDIPAVVDNDVNLAALGESWAGAAKDAGDFVFLAIGTGIGAGIMLNGQLFRGASWAAGEIGYMLISGVPDVSAKRGEPGALESMSGGEGIRAQWQNHFRPESNAPADDLTATQIFDRALDGDPPAQALLQQTAVALSRAIYNIALVLNCPLFVLGGSVGMHPALIDATRAALATLNMRTPPRLLHSVLGVDAQLIGAIRLALLTAAVSGRPPIL
ncbi:ROK-family transcriptional regulator [Acidisarcina polymorpha]|uniref:ROK-family transcriptional regulator n=2 Tax=Acidisarcina polymorpha TaxID=2211140 RepID=A0A2Z5FXW4_9BACT|nr:ROK-family transcriptional regulator [Acidisarcina polymorpha]